MAGKEEAARKALQKAARGAQMGTAAADGGKFLKNAGTALRGVGFEAAGAMFLYDAEQVIAGEKNWQEGVIDSVSPISVQDARDVQEYGNDVVNELVADARAVNDPRRTRAWQGSYAPVIMPCERPVCVGAVGVTMGDNWARPLSHDEASASDHFVWIRSISYTRNEPRIYPIHSEFFECHSEERQFAYTPRVGEGPFQPLKVLKNVYNLTPVFLLSPWLVVNTAVRDLLASCCTVEFREVIIERAFWFPYGPGDDSFEISSGITIAERTEDTLGRFAVAYACPPPREKFYQVIAHLDNYVASQYSDAETLRLGRGMSKDSSVYSEEVQISKQMVTDHGLIFGYLCRPDVYELLNPYLHRPWFCSQRYAYP